MSASSPFDPAPWVALAADWQNATQAWAGWWQNTRRATPAAIAPTDASETFDSQALAELNARYQPRFEALWSAVTNALGTPGARLPEISTAAPGDRRFNSPVWDRDIYFAYLKQSYLLYAEYLSELARAARLPQRDKQRLEFATRQYVDAIAPTNFAATNPEVMQRAFETEGVSLVEGLRNLLGDAQKGHITMTDESAFAVGRNLAMTPGSVVFRNDLIELIQYDPTTASVHKRPLVIVPPCINKYYILDLRAENSFVRHAVAQGHTTFMISWRNIPPDLGDLTWDDYLEKGPLTALRVAKVITRCATVNTLGFCVGGTLLACALAVLAARGDKSVASTTFLTTMLDFADPGDIGVYITPEFLAAREPSLCAGQRVHGSELAGAFATLRANDLVWNYVVNNYLKGRTPPAFDLLYWNSDSANLPGPMYVYYLREFYLRNRLRVPNALTMLGESVDLRRITMPVYVYGSRDDHIVPWRSAYRTTGLVGGDVTFVLGGSGHIAGVVNPPEPARRNYWENALITDDPDDWLARARSVPGSWWPHWCAWIAGYAGGTRNAPRHTGNAQYPPISPAPGDYVRATV